MRCGITEILPAAASRGLASLLVVCLSSSATLSNAQQVGQFVEPIFRVAHEEEVSQAPQMASRITPPAAQSPLNLELHPGEHPLMPAMRVAQEGLVRIDTTIADYSAMLIKEERIDGVLSPKEVAFIKVRHQPFSVYMFFLQPHKGRECLYNSGPNNTKGLLNARDCGFKKRLGVFELDPDGRLAMNGQKYPIYKLGVRNLVTELIDVANNDTQFGECEVQTKQSVINGRAATLIEVVHPVPRQNFRFYKAELFIDNELKLPIRYASYMWPQQPGQEPPLEEAYTYVNIKLNNGYTDADFDKENVEYFK
ncbi:DUF1571 domain-containing protein [Bythopirellula polymerisocia]|uniref:DUF1571 domain-containing protein n=1 Tax=Bythopirellula polymerisocia TaxID=2528003 RepID=A0A5C6CR71_9BACT|nr:DUF1571 domain-containing protein [Bythopirellula polymerisocia]TWU25931.1 hypothetical protein Pla144_31450 [Bythopirellula polymerisocia]